MSTSDYREACESPPRPRPAPSESVVTSPKAQETTRATAATPRTRVKRAPQCGGDNVKMPFGQHKGKRLADLPDKYIMWLAQCEVYFDASGAERVRNDTRLNEGAKWVRTKHGDIVTLARQEVQRRKLCLRCGKATPALVDGQPTHRGYSCWMI